jgi:hypothetical protein
MARKTTKKAKASRAFGKTNAKAKKAKVARRGFAMAAADDDHLHDDNSICSCDFEFQESDATADADLPPAQGGVTGEKFRASA